MCFYNDDYDWTASVCEESDMLAEKDVSCYECGSTIRVGEPIHRIYLQEHEECQWPEDNLTCDEWEAIGEDHDKCPVHECDFGETSHYHRCEKCSKILEAIEQMEEKEGCPPHARRPALEELNDALWEHANGLEYAKRAVEMFPELLLNSLASNRLRKDDDDQ